MLGVWRGHETVQALKIAGAGDRPVDMLFISGRESPVFLIFCQVAEETGFLYDLRLFHPVHEVFFILIEGGFINIMCAIALQKQDIFFFRQKNCLPGLSVEQTGW